MQARKLLGSMSFDLSAAVQQDQVYLRSLPTKGPLGKTARVKRFIAEVIATITTTAGGGGISAQGLHNLLTHSVTDGADYWGPVAQAGEVLAALNFLQTGRAIPYAQDANGDATIAQNTAGATRQFRTIYDYKRTNLGMPPCAALKGGAYQVSAAALPASCTSVSLTVNIYAEVEWISMKMAVPRQRFVSQAFTGTGFELTAKGLMARFFARSSIDIVAADFTQFNVTVDGFPIVTGQNPVGQRGNEYSESPAVASSLLQQTFADPIGGTYPRSMPIYPFTPEADLGDLAVGDTFTVDLAGAYDVDNWTAQILYAERLTDSIVNQQADACGCDLVGDGANTLVPLGRGNSVLVSSTLGGYTPMAIVPPDSMLARMKRSILGK